MEELLKIINLIGFKLLDTGQFYRDIYILNTDKNNYTLTINHDNSSDYKYEKFLLEVYNLKDDNRTVWRWNSCENVRELKNVFEFPIIIRRNKIKKLF